MHMDPEIRRTLIILVCTGLGLGSAILLGNAQFDNLNSNPPWTRYGISAAPEQPVAIVHIDINSSLDDPTGDVLYIRTKNGQIFSATMFQSVWSPVAQVQTWDNSGFDKCGTERTGPTDAHIWDPPPSGKPVLDSAGVVFDRPLSIITRCYILSADGSLTVWTHFDSATALIATLFSKLLYDFLGVLVGALAGVFLASIRTPVLISGRAL